MQWLERWVAMITAHPLWTMLAGLVAAAVALQMDGVIWALPSRPEIVLVVAGANMVLGLVCLVLACFAGHAAWFRARHARKIEATQEGLPPVPWEVRLPAAPIGSLYLRSVAWSAAVFGVAVTGLLSLTPMFSMSGPILVGCAAVIVAALIALGWDRLIKAAPVAGP